jgi:sulfur carrier protein
MNGRGERYQDYAMPNVTVNGEARVLADGSCVRDLVAVLGLAGRAVAVEVNREVVPRRAHDKAVLHEGDVVEVVALVGGG